MKILLTGASGLLGHTLYSYLVKEGFKTIRLCNQKRQGFQSCDLTKSYETLEVFKTINPDFIIHLVSETNVDLCEENPTHSFNLNVKSAQNIGQYLKIKPTPLINISTDQVYSKTGEQNENQALPINNYGLTKYCAEQVFSKFNSVNLRTNFFGPSKSDKKSFSDWAITELKAQHSIKLFKDVYFSPLTMDTLSKSIYQVMNNFQPGTYNLGSSNGMSKADFVLSIAKRLELSTDHCTLINSSELDTKRAQRPKDMRMDSSLFESTFSFNLPTLNKEIQKLA